LPSEALIGLAAAFVSCYEEAEQKIPLKNRIAISNAQSIWYPFATQNSPQRPPNSPPPPPYWKGYDVDDNPVQESGKKWTTIDLA
jgi:hypothetical protein